MAFAKSFADGTRRVESEAVFAFEEVGEGEFVGRGGGRLVVKMHGREYMIICSDCHGGCRYQRKKNRM